MRLALTRSSSSRAKIDMMNFAVWRARRRKRSSKAANIDRIRSQLDLWDVAPAGYVAIHDAARPLVTVKIIERVFAKAQETNAASSAEAINDTLKRADVDLVVKESVDRHQLFAMQTPQIFERSLIEDAYRAVFVKNLRITDEVSAVERFGRKVSLVLNDDFNFKVTYERDLKLAEMVLRARAS